MKRIYAFDFLKFIASLLIVFHHYQQITGLFFEEGINFCWGRFNVGLLVEFFFLLSGFLMVSYVEKIEEGLSFKSFLGKRYFRLLPMLALSAIVYEILIGLFTNFGASYLYWYAPTNIDVWGCLVTALGLHTGGVFDIQTINSPTWYISVLLICYVVFYLLVKIGMRKKISLTYLCVAMIFLGFAIETYSIDLPFLNEYVKRGYCSFFYGIIVGLIFKDRDSKPKEAVGGALLSFVVILFLLFNSESIEYGIEYFMTFVVYPSVLVIFNLSWVKKLFRGRIWKLLGDISYGIYVWHINVLLGIYIIISVATYPVSLLSLKGMLFFGILCYIVATILHFVFEKPISKLIRNKKNL